MAWSLVAMQVFEPKPERVERASARGCRLAAKGDLSAKDAKESNALDWLSAAHHSPVATDAAPTSPQMLHFASFAFFADTQKLSQVHALSSTAFSRGM